MKEESITLDAALLAVGDRVLVAVSGGVDSLSLLHFLQAQRERLGIELVAVHVHDGMRGVEADADVEFLTRTCDDWKVPFEVTYRDVPGLAGERGVGIEEAGRIARYEAFAALARKYNCTKVVTAHHADDQVETLLLHMLRGTGLDGLRGMQTRRPLFEAPGAPELVRPLLGVWRHELEAYCRDHGLAPRYDVTNDDLRYRRNRIRQELLPLLDSLAPGARQNLLHLAQQAGDEVAVLDPLARDLLERARSDSPWCLIPPRVPEWLVRDRLATRSAMEVAPLAGAPTATVRRALRVWLHSCSSGEVQVSLEILNRVARLATVSEERTEEAVDLPECGLRVRRRGDRLEIENQKRAGSVPNPETIPAVGIYALPEYSLALSLTPSPVPKDLRLPPEQACLDAEKIMWPMRLRPPRAGDRFQPLGASGTRLLSDLFIDRKIPAEVRAAWPVLEDQSGILWVCGLAVDERLRVNPCTTGCLHLRIQPLQTRPPHSAAR